MDAHMAESSNFEGKAAAESEVQRLDVATSDRAWLHPPQRPGLIDEPNPIIHRADT